MQVLVINSGSSSIKFELFDMESERPLLRGEVERIGKPEPTIWADRLGPGDGAVRSAVTASTHAEAMKAVLATIESARDSSASSEIVAVAHRVVHGGTRHVEPTLIDATVLAGHPRPAAARAHAREGERGWHRGGARASFRSVPHVAVFDTAFHHTIPPVASEYALPRELARKYGIRRYGFHGTSHAYVAWRAAVLLGKPLAQVNLVTLHLGNGASATAVRGGQSVDTSMGMTPLEGLMMGTRCGDIDPAIPGLLGELANVPREQVNAVLNFDSGLKGVCGAKRHARGASTCRRRAMPTPCSRVDMFCYRAKKYVGAYFAVLGTVDAIVFTAGIGENDPVRARPDLRGA